MSHSWNVYTSIRLFRAELYGSYRMHNYLFYCLAKHLINQFFYVLRIRHQRRFYNDTEKRAQNRKRIKALQSNTILRQAIVITILDAS